MTRLQSKLKSMQFSWPALISQTRPDCSGSRYLSGSKERGTTNWPPDPEENVESVATMVTRCQPGTAPALSSVSRTYVPSGRIFPRAEGPVVPRSESGVNTMVPVCKGMSRNRILPRAGARSDEPGSQPAAAIKRSMKGNGRCQNGFIDMRDLTFASKGSEFVPL